MSDSVNTFGEFMKFIAEQKKKQQKLILKEKQRLDKIIKKQRDKIRKQEEKLKQQRVKEKQKLEKLKPQELAKRQKALKRAEEKFLKKQAKLEKQRLAKEAKLQARLEKKRLAKEAKSIDEARWRGQKKKIRKIRNTLQNKLKKIYKQGKNLRPRLVSESIKKRTSKWSIDGENFKDPNVFLNVATIHVRGLINNTDSVCTHDFGV